MSGNGFTGRRRLVLVAILVVALATRVMVVLASPDYVPRFDSGDYDRHAQSIAVGDGYPLSAFTASPGPSAFRPPVYPYLLGGVYLVSGDSKTAGRLMGALLGVAAVWLVALIAARLWDARAGLWAAGLAAVAPPMFFLNDALINEPAYIVIELAAVLFALRARDDPARLRWPLLAGVACGLGVLTRGNAVLVVPVIAAAVWVLRPRFSRAALAAPLAVLLAAVVTVSPWLVRNAAVFDRPVGLSTQGGFAIAGIYNGDAYSLDGHRASWVVPTVTTDFAPLFARTDLDEVDLDRELRRGALEYARDHPGYVLESTVLNGLRMFELTGEYPGLYDANRAALALSDTEAKIETASFYLMVALALAGWLVWRRRGPRPPAFIWLVPLVAMIVLFPILGSTRYRTVAYPFLVIAAAPALASGFSRRA